MNTEGLILGVINGLIIGFLGVGLVLVYRANRFLNLAHAQLGVISSLLMAKMLVDWHWNWWAAFAVCLPLGALLSALVYQVLIKRLQARTTSTVVLLLASLGAAEFLTTFDYVKALGASQTALNESGGFPLAFSSSVQVGGVVLQADDILIVVLVPIIIAAILLTLRFTDLGRQIRAVAANEDEARLCGIAVTRVSTGVWAAAGAMSTLTAILLARADGAGTSTAAASSGAGLGAELLLLALGAAALGGFRSIGLTLVGALGLGLAQQMTLAQTGSAGESTLVVFVLILLIVLFRGRGIGRAFGDATTVVEDLGPLRVPPSMAALGVVRHRLAILVAGSITVAVVAPGLPLLRSDSHRFLLTLILVFALLSVSLTMLIGWAGQVSLGQVAILGCGAYMTAKLVPHGWSLPAILLVSGLVGGAVMVIIGIPALRIKGLTLAVTTLGLAVVAPNWLFRQAFFGSSSSFGEVINQAPRIGVGLGRPNSTLSLYYLTLLVLAIVVAAVYGLRHSRSGRQLIAIRDNEPAAESFGISPVVVKLAILGISGVIAGIAGGLYALAYQQVSPDQFSPDLSIAILAVPVIGGLGSLSGALMGTVALYVPTFFAAGLLTSIFGSSSAEAGIQLFLTGVGLPLTLLSYPSGLAGAVKQRIEKWLAHRATTSERPTGIDESLAIRVDGVNVSFGGIRALNAASITVGGGEIVGLIGPNGAGKSTLINVISGVCQPTSGRVKVFGRDVVGLPASYRAAFGLGRTFQDAKLFPGLTVTEAIQVALSRHYRTGLLAAMSWAPWHRASERRSRQTATQMLDRFGLQNWQNTLTSDLSTGTRRICDLALQVASGQRVLLLDEPTAGVAQREAERFGPLLRRVRDELDCSILVVEHDMPLLMSLCDRIYAMEAGGVIAEGSPADIRRNPRVIASYLGTDEVAITRSGTEAPKPPAKSGRTPPQRQPARAGATPQKAPTRRKPVGARSPAPTATTEGRRRAASQRQPSK